MEKFCDVILMTHFGDVIVMTLWNDVISVFLILRKRSKLFDILSFFLSLTWLREGPLRERSNIIWRFEEKRFASLLKPSVCLGLGTHLFNNIVCPSWPTWGMPFTAFTLQIGGYYTYQHRKLQAAQVTITKPDSTVVLFAVVMHRGTFQWKGQYENAALDIG